MKRPKTHAARITAAMNRTSFFPLFAARTDVGARVQRIDEGSSAYVLMEVAGLERTLKSYLETALFAREPDWKDVRALHAAWLAASEWSAAVRGSK